MTAIVDRAIVDARVEERVARYPRVRYMGSKYRVMPHLLETFRTLRFDSALDAFSGSGVVGYAMKALGKTVTTNDYLQYPSLLAEATIANSAERLDAEESLFLATAPSLDGRDFISRTFHGVFFPDDDLRFLDSAWSHIDTMPLGGRRAIAISALCLAAVRKQPRGVFTVSGLRIGSGYDDGRRNLTTPLSSLFKEAVDDINQTVFDNGRQHSVCTGDIKDLDRGHFDLVYLDPPYSPPQYDNDYIKRYHFLEGLACYWHGQDILLGTRTKKIRKKYTAFGYQRTFEEALQSTIDQFRESILVLSYSSNSWLPEARLTAMLLSVKSSVHVQSIPYRYTFGTHSAAIRRAAHELIFVAT